MFVGFSLMMVKGGRRVKFGDFRIQHLSFMIIRFQDWVQKKTGSLGQICQWSPSHLVYEPSETVEMPSERLFD